MPSQQGNIQLFDKKNSSFKYTWDLDQMKRMFGLPSHIIMFSEYLINGQMQLFDGISPLAVTIFKCIFQMRVEIEALQEGS